jgi:hypothetical protein
MLCLSLSLAMHSNAQTSLRPQVIRSIAPDTKRDPDLERAIRREVDSDKYSYRYDRVSLSNSAASQVLVYLPGSDYCGSGGCTTLIFSQTGENYRLVTRLTLTRTPIIVSRHRTNGWNDLILYVSGGGIQPGYYAVLPFDGKSYPEDPTAKPAKPLAEIVKGNAYLAGTDSHESDIVVSP